MTDSENKNNSKRKNRNPDTDGAVECVGLFIGDPVEAASSLIPDL